MNKVINGNILDIKTGYIVNQVNCMGVMESGIAKQIRNKFPTVYSKYIEKFNKFYKDGVLKLLMGEIQIVNQKGGVSIINIFSQYSYGVGELQTDYEAFEECLINLSGLEDKPVYFPYGIGCGLAGGGDWGSMVEIKKSKWSESKYLNQKNRDYVMDLITYIEHVIMVILVWSLIELHTIMIIHRFSDTYILPIWFIAIFLVVAIPCIWTVITEIIRVRKTGWKENLLDK